MLNPRPGRRLFFFFNSPLRTLAGIRHKLSRITRTRRAEATRAITETNAVFFLFFILSSNKVKCNESVGVCTSCAARRARGALPA